MSSPDPGQSIAPEGALEAPEPKQREENPVLGWAKAIAFGIGDTAKDMLHEGRRGAREGMEQGWDRFDSKTKRRRSR